MAETLIVTVNAGSTSLRLDAFTYDGSQFQLLDTEHNKTASGREETLASWFARYPNPQFVLHRIVHGGNFRAPQQLTDPVITELSRWTELAPLHNGPALELVQMCRHFNLTDRQQIGIFDTAPFANLPEYASRYAIPILDTPLPIHRYGFHGLAHQSMYRQWQRASSKASAGSRIISLQLGGGCSIVARRGDAIIDSSMGFTPLEGLPMATRSGDIDAGLLLYLLRHGYSVETLDDLLNRHSGLAGVSGISGDMKTLLGSSAASAQLAVQLFCYRIRKGIGAYIAALGGVDAILWGGGIGEHAAPVRQQILMGLEELGIAIDRASNNATQALPAAIHHAQSRAEIWIIGVDEAREMLDSAAAFLNR
jgi:acetate kinase